MNQRGTEFAGRAVAVIHSPSKVASQSTNASPPEPTLPVAGLPKMVDGHHC